MRFAPIRSCGNSGLSLPTGRNSPPLGDPKKGGFICPDAQLQGALRGAVKAIDQLPELRSEDRGGGRVGSDNRSVRRLTATFYGALSFKMPPSADELRELQQKAVQSVEGGGGQRAGSMWTRSVSLAGLCTARVAYSSTFVCCSCPWGGP